MPVYGISYVFYLLYHRSYRKSVKNKDEDATSKDRDMMQSIVTVGYALQQQTHCERTREKNISHSTPRRWKQSKQDPNNQPDWFNGEERVDGETSDGS